MRVLVSAASRHGATDEIGRTIATTLREFGLDAVIIAPEEVDSTAGFDAFVIGSGIYVGRWLGVAKRLLTVHADELRGRPVWLFSSGPLGESQPTSEDPGEIERLSTLCGARDHRMFAGRLDKDRLGLGEKAMVSLVHAPEGDFRSWDDITAWAADIARNLLAPAHAG